MGLGTSTTLTQEFVDLLSAQMILEPDPQYCFAELARAARARAMQIPDILGESGMAANEVSAMGGGVGTLELADARWMRICGDFCMVISEPKTPGDTILIDQPRYLDGSFAEADRVLTEGTPVSTTAQPPTMGQVTVTIKAYGGPYDNTQTAVAPIGISDFLKRRAKHDLVEYVGLLLRRDRNRFVDTVIVNLLLTATNETTPGDVADASLTAGSGLTEDMLSEMLQKLQERNIPTFANGQYLCMVSPKHIRDLRSDTAFRESVRYMASGGESPLISGHVANHGNFMIVVSNNIPTSLVGGGSVTGYQGVAFGPNAIGHAIGMDAEARRSKDDDFARQDKVMWVAHEGWHLLDDSFVQRFTTT